MRELDCRLLKLRQDLIEDICEGRIKGDQVIANILTLLKDARRNLPKAGGGNCRSRRPLTGQLQVVSKGGLSQSPAWRLSSSELRRNLPDKPLLTEPPQSPRICARIPNLIVHWFNNELTQRKRKAGST